MVIQPLSTRLIKFNPSGLYALVLYLCRRVEYFINVISELHRGNRNLILIKKKTTTNINIIEIYMVNKPLSAAVISEDNA